MRNPFGPAVAARVRRIRRWWLPLCIIGMGYAPAPSAAQCELDITPVDGEMGYRERPGTNRCEGLYVQLQTAPLHLRVVSLHRGAAMLSSRGQSVLFIHAPPTDFGDEHEPSVRVLGQPEQSGINWALAGRASRQSPVRWNLHDVVDAVPLDIDKLGLAGHTRHVATGEPLYVPVAVTPASAAPASPADASKPALGDSIRFVYQLSGAGESRACIPEEGWCSGILKAKSGDGYFDGYFETVLPPGRGTVTVEVWWPDSDGSAASDRLQIYRW